MSGGDERSQYEAFLASVSTDQALVGRQEHHVRP